MFENNKLIGRREKNAVVSIYSFISYSIARAIPTFIMVLDQVHTPLYSSYTSLVTAAVITAMNISQTFKELHNCKNLEVFHTC